MAVNWNDLSKREAEEVLATDFSKGLSQKAAKERYKQSKYKLSLQKKKMQNTDNTLDWFSFAVLLLISVVSYFVMSAWKAAFFSLICVSAVLLFVIVDQYSKKKISSHLEFFTSYVTVLRGGKQFSIPSYAVVVGDVLKLKSGDTVPCDCYVIEKKDLSLSKELFETDNLIFANSRVESGICTCVSVGDCAFSNKNTVWDFHNSFVTSSDIYKYISHISSIALIVVSFFAIITLFIDIFLKKETATVFYDFSSYFICVCGVFVSGIPLIVKISFSKFLLHDLSDKGVYINNASALDSLTEMKCAVLETDMFFSSENPVPMAFYTNNNVILCENVKASDFSKYAFFDIMFSTELNASSVLPSADKYLKGLRKNFGRELKSDAILASYRLKDDEFPFDTFLFETTAGERYASLKGELASLIRCCTTVSLGNKVISFDDGLKNAVLNSASGFISLGCDIVAYAKNSAPDISLDNTHLSHKRLTFIGFAAFAKGQAASSGEFFSICEKNDIEPVLIHYGTLNELNMYMKNSEDFRKRSFVDCEKIGDGISDIKNALSEYDGFLNPSEKQYNALLNLLSQNSIKYTYISRQNKKIHKKEEQFVDLNFEKCAEYNPEDNDIYCVVRNNSLSSFITAISSAFKYKTRILSILRFLMFLCFSKVFLMPLEIFTDNAVFTPSKTAFLVFVFDLLSLFVFFDNRKNKDIPLKRKEFLFSVKEVLIFLLLTVITFLVSKLISLFNYDSELDVLASVSFLIMLLLPPLYLIFKEKLQLSERFLIYLLAVLIFITLCVMFAPVGNLFGVISDIKILIADITASTIFFLVYYRYYKNKK